MANTSLLLCEQIDGRSCCCRTWKPQSLVIYIYIIKKVRLCCLCVRFSTSLSLSLNTHLVKSVI